MNKEIAELLRERALVGRMAVRDKQLMLEAADEIENIESNTIEQIFETLENAIRLNGGESPTEAYFGILNAIAEIRTKYMEKNR
jgi:hypothetical protein